MSTGTATPRWDLGQVFNEAFELFKKEAPLLLGGGAILWVIGTVVPIVTSGFGLIVTAAVFGPLMLGFTTAILKIIRGEPADFNLIISGFQKFVPAFLAGLLVMLFMTIGLICCVLPGLFVSMIYMLTFLYMVDKGLDYWDAMEASRKQVMDHLNEWFMMWLAVCVLYLLGTIFCTIGVIVTLPLGLLMLAVAYDRTENAGATPVPAEE